MEHTPQIEGWALKLIRKPDMQIDWAYHNLELGLPLQPIISIAMRFIIQWA